MITRLVTLAAAIAVYPSPVAVSKTVPNNGLIAFVLVKLSSYGSVSCRSTAAGLVMLIRGTCWRKKTLKINETFEI